MAQFDVYKNINISTNTLIPYYLDIQSDILEALSSRIVVPLLQRHKAGTPAKLLNPIFKINGVEVMLSIAELFTIPKHMLGGKIESLKARRDEIYRAIDFLVKGI